MLCRADLESVAQNVAARAKKQSEDIQTRVQAQIDARKKADAAKKRAADEEAKLKALEEEPQNSTTKNTIFL